MPPAKRRHGGELVAQSTNLYEILQVPKSASQREIVQRSLVDLHSLELHPDKQGGDKDMFLEGSTSLRNPGKPNNQRPISHDIGLWLLGLPGPP